MGDRGGNENTKDDNDVDRSPPNGSTILAYACATLPVRRDMTGG